MGREIAIGAPLAARLRGLEGEPVALPADVELLFVPGAFRPGSAAVARSEHNAWIVVPDAPPIARAWRAALGLTAQVVCDDRPRAGLAAQVGYEPDRAASALRVVVEGGCVAAAPTPVALPEEAAPVPRASHPVARPALAAQASARPPRSPAGWRMGIGAGLLLLAGAGWWLMAGGEPGAASDGEVAASERNASSPQVVGSDAQALAAPRAPGADALQLRRTPLTFANPTLTLDSGAQLGFGNTTAGDGRPDGWRLNPKRGTATVSAEPDGRALLRYQEDTEALYTSTASPVTPGQAVALTYTLDAGGPAIHPGRMGLLFMNGEKLVSQEFRNLETEGPGPQPMRVTATVPAGATAVQVRIAVSSPAGKSGEVRIGDLAMEVVEAASPAPFPLRRVLLVTIETFRVDHASAYGYARETTPNLSKLVAEGAKFNRHYVQVPYTRPSLSSMVTSTYPDRLGVLSNEALLPERITTMAEAFAGGGYVTTAFLAQYILAQHFGFNQGFHYFHNYRNDTPANEPVDGLLSFLQSHRDDNLFGWLHLFDPHGPYRPPAEVQDHFVGDKLWVQDNATVKLAPPKARGRFVPDYVFDEGKTERRHYVARYDADILYADQQLGRLVDWLRTEGLADSTLLMVSADHGESMTDKDKYFAHGTIWNHDLHVPMVVWAPGRVKPGAVVDAPTAHLDVLPTLLDYAGLPIAPELAGTSLRGVIDGGAAPNRPFVLSMVQEKGVERDALHNEAGLKVIVSKEGKPLEAFDLKKDPGETKNVLAANRQEADRLAAAFLDLRNAPNAVVVPAVEREIGADEKAQLEALGYAEEEH